MLKLDPYHPKTHYELALSYNEMKNKDKALEHLQVAVDIWKDADESFSLAQNAKSKLGFSVTCCIKRLSSHSKNLDILFVQIYHVHVSIYVIK